MITMREEMSRATLPWNSVDAMTVTRYTTDQKAIDRCLCCCHSSSACDYCDGRGNVKMPKKDDNLETLRELLKLRVCRSEMARTLQVSRPTLYRMIATIQTEC